jgi:putative ABC transport system substrate-binding protein
LIGVLLPLAPLPGFAAEIAILVSADLPQYRETVDRFKATSSPGNTFTEYRLDGDLSLGREAGRAIRASRTQLVFAVGLKAAVAAKLEIPDTPVVFGLVLNPSEHGLPAPNMIGISSRIPPALQFNAWRKVHPSARAIGLLYDPQQSGGFVATAHTAAREAHLTLVLSPVSRSEEIPTAYRALLAKVDAVWLIRDPSLVSEEAARFFVEEALQRRVPVFTYSPDIAQMGALVSIAVTPADIGRQAAEIGRAWLAGERIKLGRIVDPEDVQVTLNLHTAEYLGLPISPEALRLATTLIGSPSGFARQPKDPSPPATP